MDTRWLERYQHRTQHPPDDAEKVTVRDGAVTRVHRGIPPPEAHGGTARAVLLLRAFSLVLSCGTVLATFGLARRFFADKLRPLLATALVAFNPMALFINASVNNDNLLMLLTTGTLLAAVELVQAHTRPGRLKLIGLGALCGLAA